MQDKKFSPDGQSAFAARFEAQKIAFGPVVFQCVRYAWKRGILQAVADARAEGVALADLAATGRWSEYALKVVLETCLSAGVVQLKDLGLGARLAAEIATHDDWKAQPAQLEVPRAGLVEAVRTMLARTG